MPCLKFIWQETEDDNLEGISHILADVICPVLLGTIIKGTFVLYLSDLVIPSAKLHHCAFCFQYISFFFF